MRRLSLIAVCSAALVWSTSWAAETRQDSPPLDSIRALVSQLDLTRYQAAIKALTQFGDRRQGTDRNRAAIDWIEKRLKSEGCADTERLAYSFRPAPASTSKASEPDSAVIASGEMRLGVGGSRERGITRLTGVNADPAQQRDATLRALNSQPSMPGERTEVYCTKIGSRRPDEMIIVAAHMDGHGWGEAANDDGSGTALVLELARILNDSRVRTERSVRFVLWNNEETGLDGSRAYVQQRAALQGQESPKGSGKYPEPRWIAMIQHDMLLWDHGMPRKDGTYAVEQRPEADVNIEFQSTAKLAEPAMKLAFLLRDANENYAADYPAAVGNHMTHTDSTAFMDLVPSVSVRENERGMQIGAGWDPHWHQPSDLYANFSEKDFRLGLNAAQTTLGAVAQLAGATIL